MKPGTIIEAYGDPIHNKYPLGKAKLIKQIENRNNIQYWTVAFVNEPNVVRDIFIKNTNGESK